MSLTSFTPPNNSALTSGTFGVQYEVVFIPTGGVGPYRSEITSGATPLGIGTGDKILSLRNVLVTGTAGQCSCTSSTLVVGQEVIVTGNVLGGPIGPGTYYIISTNGSTTFQLSDTPDGLGVTTTAGTTNGLSFRTQLSSLVGIPTQSGKFEFNVTCYDVDNTSATNSYSLTINLQLLPESIPNAVLGDPYSQEISVLGNDGNCTFYLGSGTTLPPGIILEQTSPNTANIWGTPTNIGNFYPKIYVEDSAEPITNNGQRNYTLSSFAEIAISPRQLPYGVTDVYYSQTFTSTGGRAPYVYTLASGTLPPGLTLNSRNGTLTGTPSEAGKYKFTIQSTDTTSSYGRNAYTFTTYNASTVVVSPSKVQQGSVTLPYSVTFTASGGVLPYEFVFSGQVPPGLTYNASSATLSGIPTVAGTYYFSVKATDAINYSGQTNYSVLITDFPPPIPKDGVQVFVGGKLVTEGYYVVTTTPYTIEFLEPIPVGVEVTMAVYRAKVWTPETFK